MFSETIPTLQVAYDNSTLSVYKECPKKYEYSVIRGLRSKKPQPPLLFGNAFHKCLEHLDFLKSLGLTSHEDIVRAVVRKAFIHSDSSFGDDDKRTRLSLVRAVVHYADHYKKDEFQTHTFSNGKVGVELSFRFELPYKPAIGYHSDNYIYCGHIDKLASHNGNLYVVEHKHTTSYISNNYWKRYIFSGQVNGYKYAGKVVFSENVVGALIDTTQVGMNFVNFGRRIAPANEAHLDEWLEDTMYYIKQTESNVAEGYFPRNTESCTKYSGCPFINVCFRSPYLREKILEEDFHVDRWNPLENR